MTQQEANALPIGAYRIYWKSQEDTDPRHELTATRLGIKTVVKYDLAVFLRDGEGQTYFQVANHGNTMPSQAWERIEKVALLEASFADELG